jgi:4-amino-4-deoxy-L-arabinose transferase-like glycosyltransferase
MAQPLVGATGALLALLIIDGMHYFQYTAVKFNHDVIQLPLWALASFAYHAALKRGRLMHWLLCGVAVGAALWAKYFAVVLAAPLALFLLFDREARRSLRTPGPYLAIAAAFIVMAPHIIWLFQNDFLPFAYADARAAPARGWFDHLWHPAFFAGAQFLAVLPSLLIASPLLWSRGSTKPPAEEWAFADAFDRRIVTLLAFGPALTILAMITISGRGAITMWGYPLWIFLGVWIVLLAGPRTCEPQRVRRTAAIWSAVFTALAMAFILDYTVMPMLDHRYRAAFFPGDQLASTLTQRFHAATGGKRLRYVIGSMWIGGNVAHYSPDQPEVLIDGLPRRAPWIDLADLRAKGALLVWQAANLQHLPAPFAAIAPSAEVGPPFTLPARRFGRDRQTFGWAILMPQ